MADQAVADPAPAAAETPIAEVYNRALAEQQGEKSPPAKEETSKPATKPAKASEDKMKDKVADKAPDAPQKPTSALEAALETAKPEEKKPEGEAQPDPLAEFPEDGKNKNWKGLRGVASKAIETANQTKAENARLAKELEAARSAPPEEVAALKAENERMKREHDEMKDAITAVNIELDPNFRKKFIEGRKELVNSAIEKVKAYGGNMSGLQRALAMPEGRERDLAIEEAFGEEMTESGKNKIRNLVTEIERLDEAKAKELADPQHSYENYIQKRSATDQQKAQEADAARQSEIQRVLKSLPEQSGLFAQVDASLPDAEEWNAGLTTLPDEVNHALSPKATLSEATLLAAKGRRFDFVVSKLASVYGELTAAKKQLAEYDGAQPDAKGTRPPTKTEAQEKLEKSPGQIFTETMHKLSGGDID